MTDKYGDEYIVFKRAEWEKWWRESGGIKNDIPPIIAVPWDEVLIDERVKARIFDMLDARAHDVRIAEREMINPDLDLNDLSE